VKTRLLRRFYKEFCWKSLLDTWAFSAWADDPSHEYVRKFARTVNEYGWEADAPFNESTMWRKCASWVNGEPNVDWIPVIRLQRFFRKYAKYSHTRYSKKKYSGPDGKLRLATEGRIA